MMGQYVAIDVTRVYMQDLDDEGVRDKGIRYWFLLLTAMSLQTSAGSDLHSSYLLQKQLIDICESALSWLLHHVDKFKVLTTD